MKKGLCKKRGKLTDGVDLGHRGSTTVQLEKEVWEPPTRAFAHLPTSTAAGPGPRSTPLKKGSCEILKNREEKRLN